jgi:hypothetical protein
MKDFFVSYNKADKGWAEWIAWKLEQAGYTVIIQAWDFRPGENFVLKMQNALQTTNKMVMVLSEDYLKSSFTAVEWASVFATDPEGKKRKLVPVRVRECKPEGLLGQLIYVDIAGLSERDAGAALLGAFADRAKPEKPPKLPGKKKTAFPGKGQGTDRIVNALNQRQESEPATLGLPISVHARLQLYSNLNRTPPSQFNMLVFALNPPPGLIPPMPAAQADRSSALLGWAESSSGCGLRAIEEVLRQVTTPPS